MRVSISVVKPDSMVLNMVPYTVSNTNTIFAEELQQGAPAHAGSPPKPPLHMPGQPIPVRPVGGIGGQADGGAVGAQGVFEFVVDATVGVLVAQGGADAELVVGGDRDVAGVVEAVQEYMVQSARRSRPFGISWAPPSA